MLEEYYSTRFCECSSFGTLIRFAVFGLSACQRIFRVFWPCESDVCWIESG